MSPAAACLFILNHRYDPESDSLYLQLIDSPVAGSEEVRPGVILDFDDSGRIVAVEILRGSDHSVRAAGVRFEGERLVVCLADEREVSLPLKRYPTLAKATAEQRDQWELIGDGAGVRWEDLDLDLCVQALVAGLPEGMPAPPMRAD